MAERRMFAKTIIDSDAFLTMPLSAQALYFHLSMRGDDEGFVNKPKSVMRTIGSNDDDLKLLIMKNFIIPFESGVVVIKHWKIHNYIRGDRIKKTVYQDEMSRLQVKENGSYTLTTNECQSIDSQESDKCQLRLGKVRLDKDSIEKDICGTSPQRTRFIPPTIDEVKAYCQERKNCVDAEKWHSYYSANGWKVGRNSMKDWKAAVRTWEKGNENNTGNHQIKKGKDDGLNNKNNFAQRQYDDSYYNNLLNNIGGN